MGIMFATVRTPPKVVSNAAGVVERYSTPVPEKNKRTQIVLVTVLKFAMPTLLRLTSWVLVHCTRAKEPVERGGGKRVKSKNGERTMEIKQEGTEQTIKL